MGLPTMWERPMTRARLPFGSTPASSSSRMTPAGVQGRGAGLPSQSAPTLSGWNPSASLAGEIASSTLPSSTCFGSGSCTRMPWVSGSALSRAMRASRSASLTEAGRWCSTERIPTSSQAFRFPRT